MKKSILTIVITLLAGGYLMAADLYWVGGSGNWNDASKWSLSSGGPGGAGVPTTTDNVFFDASSFTADSKTVTINTNAVCADMSWVGAQHTPILQRDATTTRTLSIYGSLTLIAQMNFNFLGVVYFESAFVGKTITSAGQSFKNHVYFQGEGGYVLQDNFTQINNFIVHFVRGSLNLNDKDFNVNSFSSNYTNVRVLNFGSSIITISFGANNTVNAFILNGTNLDFTSGTSLIRFTGNNFQFTATGGLVFNEMVSESAIGTSRILSTNGTFKKITINNAGILNNKNTIDTLIFNGIGTINTDNNIIGLLTANQTLTINNNNGSYGHVSINGNGNLNGTNNTYGTLVLTPGKLYTFRHGNTHIIGDVLTANGNCAEPIILQSSSSGNQATIRKTSGSVTISYCMLQDIKTDGAAIFTANSSYDLGNNTGWIINAPTPLSFYWRGESGDWNVPANWRDQLGNPTDCVPSQFDNVFFDALSFSGAVKTVTVTGDENSNIYCNNMNWTGVTGNHKITSGIGQSLYIHGSLTLVSGMEWDFKGDVYFTGEDEGKSSYNITSAGQKFKRHVYLQGTGSYELTDHFEITGSFNLRFDNGGLALNNINLKAHRFIANVTNQRTLTFGSSTIELSYSDNSNSAFIIVSDNLVFNSGTSLIRFIGASPGFSSSGPALTYNNVSFTGSGTNSRISAAGCTFNQVLFNHRGSLSGGENTVNFLSTGENATINGNNNNITTMVVGGDATINNNNGYYGHVTLNGNGTLNGSGNTYGTLIFTPGNLYKFQSGQTHHITNDWFANGTEERQITVEASTTTQATINKASGNNVVVEWVKLKYNKAVGGPGVTYTANNSFDEGNNEGWTINAPGGRDLYWVGGTGNWNDASNWSLESDGEGGAGIPSALDNVFFDEFSFSGSDQIVTVIGDATNDAFCLNMDWTGVTGNHKIVALNTSQKLNIHGSLVLVSGMDWDFNGDVYFKGEDTGRSSYTITSAGRKFKRHIYFLGTGSYELEDDFEISGNFNVYFDNGGLVLNNILLKSHAFLANVGNKRTLTLGSSTIELSYSYGAANTLVINGTNLNFNSGTSLIRFTGAGPGFSTSGPGITFNNVIFEGTGTGSRITAPNCTFNQVLFNYRGSLSGGGITVSYLSTGENATLNGNGNNITTLVVNGNATINNENGNFGHATLHGDGTMAGSNSFGTLILTAGKTYTFAHSKTQIILNDLIAEGTCAEPMTIQSGSTTLQTNLNKASGTVTVTRAFMQGLNATGSALFEAINCVDINNSNTGWEFIVVPENLYWVGGSGSWSDVNKWSNNSGGVGGYCAPSRLDNVIFDANSFFQEAQFVQIDITNAECYNMDWTGVQFVPTFMGVQANNLSIYGSLTFSPAMNFTFAGNVYFEGQSTARSAYNIYSAGKSFNRHVYFNGVGGEWNLLDNFSAGSNNIYLQHGTVNTNDHPVGCGSFISNNTNVRSLNMGASVFTLSSNSNEAWLVNSPSLALSSGSSEIIFTAAGGGLRSYGANILSYNKVTFQNAGGTSILNSRHLFADVVFNPVGSIRDGGFYGNVTMNRGGDLQNNSSYSGSVKLYGNTSITGTNNFARLLLGPGNTFTFPSGLIQTISGRFIIWGSAANPITIQSSTSGNRATVSKSTGTVLGNYIQLKDMAATGGATFNLYSSVDNGNNIGWNFLDPTNETLAGITVSNLQTECWEATEIITVGGTDHFTVQNGGSATLIAGFKIEILPGTRVFSGGYFHAYITPYGFFCDTISTMLASEFVEEIAEEPIQAIIKENLSFRIFPNPTTGQFTLELSEVSESSTVVIEISSMVGERIIRQELPAAAQYQIDLSHFQPGIYLVRVIQGNETGVLKVVRR